RFFHGKPFFPRRKKSIPAEKCISDSMSVSTNRARSSSMRRGCNVAPQSNSGLSYPGRFSDLSPASTNGIEGFFWQRPGRNSRSVFQESSWPRRAYDGGMNSRDTQSKPQSAGNCPPQTTPQQFIL